MKLNGIFPALTTPFENGEVVVARLVENLARYAALDLGGYLALGSTGEGILLDETERRCVLQAVRAAIPGGTPLIASMKLGREPSEEENDRGRAILREVLAGFLTPELWEKSITRVYTDRFTAAELNEMVRFYGSPVGRKVLSLEGEVTDAVDDEIGKALGEERLEEFIARVDEALRAEFGFGDGQGS